jgi:exonuclease VII small subunit
MIRFFGMIKRKLLSENKISRYLLYATGETVLVVIGILIALQINNWNENRKSVEKEVDNLENLKTELTRSLGELKVDKNRILTYYRSTENIYNYIQNKPVPVDSMFVDFYRSVQFSFTFPISSTYETFKSGNLELIRSEDLRALITDVYESGYKRIQTKVNTRRNAARLLFPYYQKNFRTRIISKEDPVKAVSYLGIPNDYVTLINDSEYESLIAEALVGRRMEIRDFERTIELVEACIEEIEKYLQQ